MATVGDIAIVVGADVGPMVRELGKGKGALNDFGKSGSRMGSILGSAMGRMTVGAGAAAVAVIALTKASMSNIDAMSKQARAIGISVASFQSMAMVAEEAGVESDKLSKILIKMQDNIASLGNGTKAQVEQFNALGISMADLAGLGADEQFALIAEKLDAIADPATKTAAALNVFGKSGADAITMFKGYGAAAAEAAAFQQKFGITVSDLDAQQIERANDAMGRLGMAASGLGNVLAVALAPAVESFANGLLGIMEAVNGTEAAMERVFGTMEKAKAILGEEQFNAMMKTAGAVEEYSDQLRLLNVAFQPVQEGAMSLSMSLTDVAVQLNGMGLGEKGDQFARIATEMREAAMAFGEGAITAEEFEAKMEAGTGEAARLFAELSKVDGVEFSLVKSQLGSLIGKLIEATGFAAGLRAMLPGENGAPTDMTTGVGLSGDVSGLMPPSVGGVTTSPRPRGAPALLGEPESGKSSGGGGGANPMTARIEALIESLKTETEIVAAWYEESLAALNAASDAELEALGGKHEAMERLEGEHQQRLNAIREMGNQWGLQAALGGAAEILGAMGQSNKKALKAQKVFAAASAFVDTYQGAAKELKAGTFGFTRAAAVIAKGMGFVAAIRGVSDSGGGGGSRGGGAAAAPQQAVQTMNFHLSNDPFGFGDRFARQLVEQMNSASRNGMNIRGAVI